MDETEIAGPHTVIERLVRAMNDRDIEAFVGCFDPGYRSDQPAHPARSFEGSEQVRKNWSALFESMPDFLAELLSFAEEGERAWAESFAKSAAAPKPGLRVAHLHSAAVASR